MRNHRTEPGPGQESVWDYPRPPRVEESGRHVVVVFGGVVVADTHAARRVLETSHPPVYYVPQEHVRMEHLEPASGTSYCEYKGHASYYTLRAGKAVAPEAAWYYPQPCPGYESIRGHVAFYPGRVDACYVDGELVRGQEGGFYGGWVTSDVVGAFKGAPGTRGW